MIRIVAKRVTRWSGHVQSEIETLDIEHEELEKLLTRGGFGGGVDDEDFDYTELIGAEIRKAAEKENKK